MDCGGVVHVVIVSNHPLCIIDAIGLGRSSDLVRTPPKSDNPAIKGTRVVDKDLSGVSNRINGNEDRLNLLGEMPELRHGFGDVAESCRADIRTMRVTEEDQQPLAAEILIRDFAPGCGIDQLEWPSHRWTLAPMQPKDRGDGNRQQEHCDDWTPGAPHRDRLQICLN